MAPIEQDPTRPVVTAGRRIGGRLRVVAIRYRIGRWAAAIGSGLLAAMLLAAALAEAESARSDWGSSVELVVTRQAMTVGDPVTEATAGLATVPAHLAPAGALTELPLGQRVTTDVGVGEILVGLRLTSRAGSAASIALPPRTRGVTLDRSQVVGEVGDVVDLHALVSGVRLAQGVVVHAGDLTITVAVPEGDVARVVDAISLGGLVSVLVP